MDNRALSVVPSGIPLREMPYRLAVFAAGPIYTMNQERRDHYHKRAARVKTIRTESFYKWKQRLRAITAPRPPVHVTVHPYTVGRAIDADACLPTAKAMLDAYVDTESLSNDGPDQVGAITYFACQTIKDQRNEGVWMIISAAPLLTRMEEE